LYYYYTNTVEAKVKPLISFILSKDGQNIVLAEGFVPIS
jgi:ABC-type phosphate transport system substrate-binding protein